MKRSIVLSLIAGIALGAAAVQGLHAQAKHKAYSVTELELIDAAAQQAYAPLIQAAQSKAGGQNLYTAGGRVVGQIGQAPKLVAIVEWPSVEQAEAFYKSKEFNDLAPQRDKAVKQVRRYSVEVTR